MGAHPFGELATDGESEARGRKHLAAPLSVVARYTAYGVKQSRHHRRIDPSAAVADREFHPPRRGLARAELDESILCEFECVRRQIEQDTPQRDRMSEPLVVA